MSGHSRSRRGALLLVYAALVFVFIYLPVIVLILYSFNRDGVGGFPPRHLTLAWYRQLFADAPLWVTPPKYCRASWLVSVALTEH